MERFLQVLLNGVSLGSLYATLALAIVIAFRSSGHLNFAQGEVALFCTYVVWQFNRWGLPLWAATVVGVMVGVVLGGLVEVTLIRPLGRRSPLAVFVGVIALFLGLNELDGAVWGGQAKPIGSLFPNEPNSFVEAFGATFRWTAIGSVVVMVVVAALLWLLFRRTRAGLAMRAVASNEESARLVGIRTSRVLMGSWALSGAVGAVAGVLVAGVSTNVNQSLMLDIFIAAAAAATLGGFDSPGGAIVGGLVIGVVENLAAEYQSEWIGQDLRIAPALLLMLLVLLVRPSGLFGTRRVERV